MKPAIATMMCNVMGHPGLRKLARDVRNSGRASALLYWRCPRCGVEVQSIEVEPLPGGRPSNRPAT